jgi:hypothetical protein
VVDLRVVVGGRHQCEAGPGHDLRHVVVVAAEHDGRLVDGRRDDVEQPVHVGRLPGLDAGRVSGGADVADAEGVELAAEGPQPRDLDL